MSAVNFSSVCVYCVHLFSDHVHEPVHEHKLAMGGSPAFIGLDIESLTFMIFYEAKLLLKLLYKEQFSYQYVACKFVRCIFKIIPLNYSRNSCAE